MPSVSSKIIIQAYLATRTLLLPYVTRRTKYWCVHYTHHHQSCIASEGRRIAVHYTTALWHCQLWQEGHPTYKMCSNYPQVFSCGESGPTWSNSRTAGRLNQKWKDTAWWTTGRALTSKLELTCSVPAYSTIVNQSKSYCSHRCVWLSGSINWYQSKVAML